MKKTFVLAALSFLAIGMNAQSLIKNGTFDTPLNAETYESVPASADWFVMDKTSGATTITPVKDDEKHGNAVQIENTTDILGIRLFWLSVWRVQKRVFIRCRLKRKL